MSRSVQVSKAMGLVSFSDAMILLTKYGMQAEDVVTVARGPPGSRDLEITFTSADVMATFCDAGPKSYRGSTFSVVRYDKQILEARVHWLLVNVRDSVLRQIFEGFGRIISKFGNAFIKSGIRIVQVEVVEVGKSRVSHLLQFECGSRALVTLRHSH